MNACTILACSLPIDSTSSLCEQTETAIAETQRATRRLARRQRAWFHADDPRIRWSNDLDTLREILPKPSSLPTILL